MTKRSARQPTKPTTSEREKAHKKLLEEALKQPGIREAMRVYDSWRRAEHELDPYYELMGEQHTYITTDRSNPEPPY